MRGAREPVFEHDFPQGSDTMGISVMALSLLRGWSLSYLADLLSTGAKPVTIKRSQMPGELWTRTHMELSYKRRWVSMVALEPGRDENLTTFILNPTLAMCDI
jgi:hypothetical protein